MSNFQNISRVNQYIVSQLQRGYVLKGKSSEELCMNFQKILYDHKKRRDPTWYKESTRLFEIPRPGRVRDLAARELKRKLDRQQIAFLCKHVMAERDIKIPKS